MALKSDASNRLGFAVIAILIAAALIMYVLKMDVLIIISSVIIIFGIYMMLSAAFKNRNVDQFGTSESGAALAIGSFVAAIGCGILAFKLSDNWIIAVAVFILVVAVWKVVSIVFNKSNRTE